jgi:hypothetical protein
MRSGRDFGNNYGSGKRGGGGGGMGPDRLSTHESNLTGY